MIHVLGKFAAMALLLLIPLQGATAVSLSVLQCPPTGAGTTHLSNSDDGTAQGRGDGAIKNYSEHNFCHPPFSGIPVIPAATAMPELPVLESSFSLLSSLFSPEQPQRPPFAASA